AVLLERRPLQPVDFGLRDPSLASLNDGHASARSRMRAASNLNPGFRQPRLSCLLLSEGLNVTLAFLVEIIGDKGGLNLAARRPSALADRCHRDLPLLDSVCRKFFRCSINIRSASENCPPAPMRAIGSGAGACAAFNNLGRIGSLTTLTLARARLAAR